MPSLQLYVRRVFFHPVRILANRNGALMLCGGKDDLEVVVVGAGAARLGAALRLATARVSFNVFEARRRAGGRALPCHSKTRERAPLSFGWLTLRLSPISRRGMLGSVQSFHFKLPKGRGGLAAPFLAIRSRIRPRDVKNWIHLSAFMLRRIGFQLIWPAQLSTHES